MSNIKQTVLITGITGFLGKSLTKYFIDTGYNVVGTGHSESGIYEFEILFPDVKVYSVDIADGYHHLSSLMKTHRVDYVVHSAAHKHVKICENNPNRAVEVNIIGSMNVLNACLDAGVKNAIAISTDKAVNPSCVYGMTKKLMEEMFLERGYSVFQGVNFLFSTCSVLDIWDKARSNNNPILANQKATRYFCKIYDVCDSIYKNLNNKQVRFTVHETYKIKISDLQKAYSEYHDYSNIGNFTPLIVEKDDEDAPVISHSIVEPDIKKVKHMLYEFYFGKHQ